MVQKENARKQFFGEAKMFKKYIHNWKYSKDQQKKLQVMKILQSFWFPSQRQNFIIDLILEENLNSEELDCISNIIGRESHQRNRQEKYKND